MSNFQAPSFEPYRKIPRLNRDITITEKLDGTNAQILIEPDEDGDVWAGSKNRWLAPGVGKDADKDNYGFAAWVAGNEAEIRRTLGPGVHRGEWWGAGIQRKYGLTAKRFSLFNVSRYGEQTAFLDPRCTWGGGDSPEAPVDHKFHKGVKVCACREARAAIKAEIGGVVIEPVPVLYRGPWFGTVEITPSNSTIATPYNGYAPALALQLLETEGSVAAPGFMDPEGIVVFHEASGQLYKVTLTGDEKPKGAA